MRQLQYLSLAEGTTLLLLLCIGLPVKYFLGYPIATKLLGSLHGIVFIAYIAMLLKTLSLWTPKQRLQLFVLAFIPFGGFINEKLIKQKCQHNNYLN